MKAITAIPAPVTYRRQSVKKLLIKVIICLTSEKFFTFAAVIGCLIEYIGVLIEDDYLIVAGAVVFLIGFTPWSWRQTRRDIRQDKLGLKEW